MERQGLLDRRGVLERRDFLDNLERPGYQVVLEHRDFLELQVRKSIRIHEFNEVKRNFYPK
jgi:hypothetical protein